MLGKKEMKTNKSVMKAILVLEGELSISIRLTLWVQS